MLLELKGIEKRFGGLVAVNGLDVGVREGQIHALIGPNGAGKTTVFNLITKAYLPTAGQIVYDGADITSVPVHRVIYHGIARTFQNIHLFKDMTVLENVLVGLHCRTRVNTIDGVLRTRRTKEEEEWARRCAGEAIRFVGLEHRASFLAKYLPYGEQKLVELARALVSEPRLLLLDEPAAGMNPSEKEFLSGLISRIKQTGKTILLIEHSMRFVMSLSDTITVLNHGVKVAEGTPSEIQANDAVIEAYLGKSSRRR